MKQLNPNYIALVTIFLTYTIIAASAQQQPISPKQIALVQNKYLRDKFVDEHHIDHYVHIPASVKTAISACITAYPELTSFINLSMFTQDTQQIITQEEARTITQELIALLNESALKNSNPIDTTIEALEQYLRDIESGKLHIASDPLMENIVLSPSGTRASQNLFQTNTGLAIAGGGIINISGVSNIGTQGFGNIVTISLNSSISISGPLIITNGGIFSTGPTILSSLSGPGVVTASSTGVLSTSATTNNAVQIGNITGTLTSIPVGTNGQVLIGASGAAPLFSSLTSNGTIIYSSGPNSLNLNVNPNLSLTGSLSVSGAVNITGAVNINGILNVNGGINATGPINFNSLTGPGAVTVSSTGLLGSARATTNGQLLLGVSGGLPFFTGLSSPANPSGATSIIYSSGPNFLSLQSVPLFANVLRADWLNGNDATATVINGIPFKTISAALTAAGAAASSVSPYVIWVMPGIYNETLTMQQFVSVVGMSPGAGLFGSPTSGVVIQQLGVTTNTTLVTMAENARLDNVTLLLTSASTTSTTLRGIQFSGTMSTTSVVNNVTLEINHTGTGTPIINGIYISSAGMPTPEISALRNSTVSVYASGAAGGASATVRGIEMVSPSGIFNASYCNIGVANTGVANVAFGAETTGNGVLNINNSIITAATGAAATANQDINQTVANTLTLNYTKLARGTANGVNFVSTPSSFLSWSFAGTETTSVAQVMLLGGGGVAGTNYTSSYYTANRPLTLKNLRAATTANVTTNGAVFTLFTGIPTGTTTSLTATIAAGSSTASDTTHSVTIPAGTSFYMQISSGGAGNTVAANPVVTVEMY